jgi:hypothetical protein
MAIEFSETIEQPVMTPERQAAIDHTVKHWVTTPTGLEFVKCGPDCDHGPPACCGNCETGTGDCDVNPFRAGKARHGE